MALDHEAIYLAYKDKVFSIDDSPNSENDRSDSVTLDAEAAAILYQKQRTGEAGTTHTIYLPLAQQLDMRYWDSVNGTTTWKDHIAAVKAKYPKP